MHLLNHVVQAGDFLTQNHRDSINQRLINHLAAGGFTDAGIAGVVGKHHNIASKIRVLIANNNPPENMITEISTMLILNSARQFRIARLRVKERDKM